MGLANTYTEKQILDGLRVHMLDNLASKYSMFEPCTWQCVLKRMAKCKKLTNKVNTIVNEHNYLWEQMGIEALKSNDGDFNVPLFKMYASSKKSMQSYEVNELEERINKLEQDNEHP